MLAEQPEELPAATRLRAITTDKPGVVSGDRARLSLLDLVVGELARRLPILCDWDWSRVMRRVLRAVEPELARLLIEARELDNPLPQQPVKLCLLYTSDAADE